MPQGSPLNALRLDQFMQVVDLVAQIAHDPGHFDRLQPGEQELIAQVHAEFDPTDEQPLTGAVAGFMAEVNHIHGSNLSPDDLTDVDVAEWVCPSRLNGYARAIAIIKIGRASTLMGRDHLKAHITARAARLGLIQRGDGEDCGGGPCACGRVIDQMMPFCVVV